MNNEELSSRAGKNPPLFLALARRSEEELAKITLFSADSTRAETEKYRAFCAKLKFMNAPYLMVFEDDFAKQEASFLNTRAWGGQISGYYDSLSNAVGITRTMFEAFKHNVRFAERVVAHELGHTKHITSRRRFIDDTAAMVGGSTIAALAGGFAAKKTVDGGEALIGRKIDALVLLRFPAAVYAASLVIPKIRAIMQREREFTADRYASRILGKNIMITSMAAAVERRVISMHGEKEILAIRALFDDEVGKITDHKKPAGEALELAYAMFLANQVGKKLPLREIWKHAPYPRYVDRIRRLAR